jgi:hypothetical protein
MLKTVLPICNFWLCKKLCNVPESRAIARFFRIRQSSLPSFPEMAVFGGEKSRGIGDSLHEL